MDTPFSARFNLVLKALSVSRGRMAADLGVDKSLVGRWASGAVKPSEHNCANLTRLIAGRLPGFTMLDWDRDLAGFARLCGVELPVAAEPPAPAGPALLPPALIGEARRMTERRGASLEGFWRTTRPSVIMDGRMFNDHGMIRTGPSGLLEVRIGGAGLLFEGWMLPAEGNLFCLLYDSVGMTPLFLVFKGVPLPKVDLLDGLLLFAALNAGRTPAAVPVVLERIGELAGDTQADDATCRELIGRNPVAGREEVPETILRHLIRDMGPAAAAGGGDMFLLASAAGLSRPSTASGRLSG